MSAAAERESASRRGTDWRLLLPGPAPRTAACLGPDELSRSLRAAGIDVVAPGAHAPVDLVAAVDPGVDDFHRALRSLKPGGTVYLETRRLRGGRARLSRLLAATGLERVSIYWLLRRGAVTSAWVSLADPAIAQYILTLRDAIRVGRVPVPKPVARLGFLLLRRADALAPLVAVARAPVLEAPAHEAPALDAGGLLDRLGRGWPGLTGEPTPQALDWLLVAPGSSSVSKIVGFVFAAGSTRPDLVVKTGRTPVANAALEREAANLEALQLLPAARHPGTPRCLDVDRRADGTVAVVETFVAGAPLYRDLTYRTLDTIFERAADWLAGLVYADDRQALGDVVSVAADRTGETLQRLGDAATTVVPCAFEQRDFSPWNVLLDGTKLGVVDWESAEPRGLLALDLIYFLANCGFILDRAATVDDCIGSYRRTLGRDAPADGPFARCLRRYSAGNGIDEATLRSLRACTWLVHLANARRIGDHGERLALPSGERLFEALSREELT